MDKIDLPMLAGKRMESNNLAELKPVWKNLYVRLSKNFRHTKLILEPISRCDSVQTRGFCEKAWVQKPNKQNTFYIIFVIFGLE